MKRYIRSARSNKSNYNYNQIATASRKCKQIQEIICNTVDISFNTGRGNLTGDECFDEASAGYDSDAVTLSYDILSSMYDLASDSLYEQVKPEDIVCLVFAEVSPNGEVYTDDSGLLNFCTNLKQYKQKYGSSDNLIKTIYCNLPINAGIWDSMSMDNIVPDALKQIQDTFESLGYACTSNSYGDRVEIARSAKNLRDRESVTLTIDPSIVKRYSKEAKLILIPGEYFDPVRGKVNLPKSFIDEVCETVNNAYTTWPRKDYWYSIDYDDDEMEEAWEKYLEKIETKVNKKLKVFPEPSVQGMMGYVTIHDESGKRDWEEEPEISYSTWVQYELEMAQNSNSPADYEKQYEKYLNELCTSD